MKLELRLLSILTLASTVALASGCPADDNGAGDTAATATGGTTPGTGNDTASATGNSMSSMSGMSMSGTTDPTDTSATITVGDTEGATGEPVDPVENGEMCTTNEQCISGQCFVITGLGGYCGECLGDADCEGGGCSLPNPLAMPPVGATCNMGGLGEGCETADVCVDPDHVCALIIDAAPLVQASTCSECNTTADCTGDQVCGLSIDVANISGQKTCVDPGTVPDGDFCDIAADDADASCLETSFCASASLMGFVEFGVCSPCKGEGAASEGCDAGFSCIPPDVGLDNVVIPAMCVPE